MLSLCLEGRLRENAEHRVMGRLGLPLGHAPWGRGSRGRVAPVGGDTAQTRVTAGNRGSCRQTEIFSIYSASLTEQREASDSVLGALHTVETPGLVELMFCWPVPHLPQLQVSVRYCSDPDSPDRPSTRGRRRHSDAGPSSLLQCPPVKPLALGDVLLRPWTVSTCLVCLSIQRREPFTTRGWVHSWVRSVRLNFKHQFPDGT